MIRFVDNSTRSPHKAALLTAMHLNRGEIFGPEGFNWVPIHDNGIENDRFDACNPLYVISVSDKTGEYQASLRLLPTTGPNMIADVPEFRALVDQPIQSATIWESSRICSTRQGTGALNELIQGIGEVCRKAGLTQIVSLFDERMYRLLRMKLKIDVIGGPARIGNANCIVGLFGYDDDTQDAYLGKNGPVTVEPLELEAR